MDLEHRHSDRVENPQDTRESITMITQDQIKRRAIYKQYQAPRSPVHVPPPRIIQHQPLVPAIMQGHSPVRRSYKRSNDFGHGFKSKRHRNDQVYEHESFEESFYRAKKRLHNQGKPSGFIPMVRWGGTFLRYEWRNVGGKIKDLQPRQE